MVAAVYARYKTLYKYQITRSDGSEIDPKAAFVKIQNIFLQTFLVRPRFKPVIFDIEIILINLEINQESDHFNLSGHISDFNRKIKLVVLTKSFYYTKVIQVPHSMK